ncbi:LysE family translocator [Belliella pelovolcani]|uniref:Threonine/homoserine/homoserine lactone efflux protein n=1 Tax=Belliella pelovolcani TaxID=529505 RepID=A0A1N7LAC9_9BACT|nr:LysE family transporter [Belliella pelovolcani]SIS70835.1 Threonine/homoserine/homoserine lactone efflux protein [Belliella pelovolcani]
MIQALLEGVSMGLILSAMIGPVFFTLVQNSIAAGFRNTAVLATGIFLSDLIYVVITYFSVSAFAQNPYFEVFLGYGGALVLIGFGVSTFFKKTVQRPNSAGIDMIKPKKMSAFFKGFSINGVNPFVLLFWISIAGLVSLKDEFTSVDVFLYYVGILLTVFLIDLLKAFVAKQLKPFVTPKFMVNMNRVVAVVLIFFGVRLILFAYEKHQALKEVTMALDGLKF